MIPSFLLASSKSLSLGHIFKEEAASVRDFAGERIPGFGYSPVAEAYVNFDFFGVPIVFFLFGLIFRGTQRFLSAGGGIFRAYIAVILCVRMVTFFRASFYPWFNLTVKQIVFGCIIIGGIVIITQSVIYGRSYMEKSLAVRHKDWIA
jgi:hypothetical protein